MKIVTLLENEAPDKKLKAAHGLSFYIETESKKILFDIGPNNYYEKNAKQLGVDLNQVDYVIISHGHSDHGTGLGKFLRKYKKAEAFVSEKAFNEYVVQDGNSYYDIGIGKKPKSDRVNTIYREARMISPGITVYDKVQFNKQIIQDKDLKMYEDGHYIKDHFQHELYLIIHEGFNKVLVTGCSHRGIETIIDTIEKDLNIKITHVFGGLHFSEYDSFNFKETDYLIKLSDKLGKKKKIDVFACHCTGDEAFFELKKNMKDKIKRLKTGSIVEI